MIISFDEAKHQYTNEKGEIIPSVTQILGKVYGTGLENAPEYFVNRAAEKGTKIHAEIETYLKEGKQGQTPEFNAWHKVFNNTPVIMGKKESEKIIFAITGFGAFAGTVDLLGNGFLYDWKTCKTATRQQIQKWQKQLSFYCYALRQMGHIVNEPLKIVHLTDSCEVINVDYLGDEFVEETMRLYQAGETPKEETYELETVPQKDLQVFEDILLQMQALETVADSYRTRIKEEMERRGILNLQVGRVKITLVPATIRQSFDTKAFKQDDPDLYSIYLKNAEVKPSLRITVK